MCKSRVLFRPREEFWFKSKQLRLAMINNCLAVSRKLEYYVVFVDVLSNMR